MLILRALTVLFALAVSLPSIAVIETYEFKTADQQARFKTLVAELRCPKCQNQNLADSNSEIATDLRAEVYRLIDEGQSDEMIVDHLVARYGEFVRYRPAVDSRTIWLWGLPAIMLLIGLIVAFLVARNSAPKRAQTGEALTEEQRQRLEEITRGQS